MRRVYYSASSLWPNEINGGRTDQNLSSSGRIFSDPTFPKSGNQHFGELIVAFDVKHNSNKRAKNNLDFAYNIERFHK